MLLHEPPQLGTHQGALRAAEAGGDEDRVRVVVVVRELERPGDHELELGAFGVEPELLDRLVYLIHVHIRIDHLGPYGLRGPLDLGLDGAILRTAGKLGDLDHFSPSRNSFTLYTMSLASSSLDG